MKVLPNYLVWLRSLLYFYLSLKIPKILTKHFFIKFIFIVWSKIYNDVLKHLCVKNDNCQFCLELILWGFLAVLILHILYLLFGLFNFFINFLYWTLEVSDWCNLFNRFWWKSLLLIDEYLALLLDKCLFVSL